MARRPSGQVIAVERRGGTTYSLRVSAYGRRYRVRLGAAAEGWTHARAETELHNVLADIRRGSWRPPVVEPPPPDENETFHEFASRWWAAKKAELRPKTREAYEIEMCVHLLPFFQHHRLRDITVAEVDRYRTHKLRQWEDWQRRPAEQRPYRLRPAGPPQINATIKRLAQILEDAVEYELLARNPARGKRRRLKVSKAPRPHLDRAAHIEATLEAAALLDAQARKDRRHVARHAIVGVLLLAGLRIEELTGLRWLDVDLGGGVLRIGASKTDAGVRRVDIAGGLQPILRGWRHRSPHPAAEDFVFATGTGQRNLKDNLRARVVYPTFRLADVLLHERGEAPLPEGLTPHGLRHTFASMLVATGEDPRYVMGQLGHTDPGFTLGLYAHAMRRDEGEKERIQRILNPRPPST